MNGLVLGKLALVTGAGSGIGRATCQVLAREGAKVVAADSNFKAAKETLSLLPNTEDHISLDLNVKESSSIKQALMNIIKFYKKAPTVVVNCAGIIRDNFLLKLSEEDFQEVIDVNLKGTFLVTQTFVQAMVEEQVSNGSIINIASVSGKYGQMGQSNYSASKAGVEGITKTAAKEFGQFGIRCNAILPGFIVSPMTDSVPEKVKAKIMPLITLRRFGTTNEVAEVITFLASDRSSYINGSSIEVTGGY